MTERSDRAQRLDPAGAACVPPAATDLPPPPPPSSGLQRVETEHWVGVSDRLHGHWVGNHWECRHDPVADRPYQDMPLLDLVQAIVETGQRANQPFTDRMTLASQGCALWAELVARETR